MPPPPMYSSGSGRYSRSGGYGPSRYPERFDIRSYGRPYPDPYDRRPPAGPPRDDDYAGYYSRRPYDDYAPPYTRRSPPRDDR